MDFNTKFRNETKKLVLDILKFTKELPKTEEAFIIKKQLIRSVTSVAANFRAFSRGRSLKERYAKLCIVVEESDESLFWLEILSEGNIVSVSSDIMDRMLMITKVMSRYRSKMKSSLSH